jgi:hypothetical protein
MLACRGGELQVLLWTASGTPLGVLGAVLYCADEGGTMRIVISALFLFVFSLILCYAPADWRGKPRDQENE